MNKDIQYVLLFCLYIVRGGRVTVDIAAKNLDISLPFLQQIARKLKLGGVVRSVRGPGGGYELIGEPTVEDVFKALSPVEILSTKDVLKYSKGEIEHRVLVNLGRSIHSAMRLVLKRKIKDVCKETEANEAALLRSLDVSGGIH